mmetsp:Transcript_50793/g.107786  ORF Transcript_50793/g.107786 Transcript_50793/m.107786 type:complete len:385 (+) Transcript_50793:465-1619(+)
MALSPRGLALALFAVELLLASADWQEETSAGGQNPTRSFEEASVGDPTVGPRPQTWCPPSQYYNADTGRCTDRRSLPFLSKRRLFECYEVGEVCWIDAECCSARCVSTHRCGPALGGWVQEPRHDLHRIGGDEREREQEEDAEEKQSANSTGEPLASLGQSMEAQDEATEASSSSSSSSSPPSSSSRDARQGPNMNSGMVPSSLQRPDDASAASTASVQTQSLAASSSSSSVPSPPPPPSSSSTDPAFAPDSSSLLASGVKTEELGGRSGDRMRQQQEPQKLKQQQPTDTAPLGSPGAVMATGQRTATVTHATAATATAAATATTAWATSEPSTSAAAAAAVAAAAAAAAASPASAAAAASATASATSASIDEQAGEAAQIFFP